LPSHLVLIQQIFLSLEGYYRGKS